MEQIVLLVEDESLLADSMTLTLTKAGYGVVCTQTSQAALDALDENRIALIVLDIFLPGGNGIQLLHEIKSHEDTAKIPVIVCTSAFRNVPFEALKKYGVDEVLDKSQLSSAFLREKVNAILKV